MRFSTKSRFAVDAMIDLAIRERAGPVALASVCKRLGVSLSFLEQLFSRLRRAGLVESARGPGGGYTLARVPAEITVAEIIGAVESGRTTASRLEMATLCPALWDGVDTVVLAHLEKINLGMLAQAQRVPVAPRGDDRATTPVASAVPQAPRRVARTVPNSVFALGSEPS